ncbi:pantoate--beta-alanine ligase [uncultured Eudoraea sp.]|uniref:pantoate--beta-alanine ligase n=1 Tax=uncultured Eudoraea sp. TaxID=1035614 RepID=UPI002625AB66|nr:pantoate--beta-alanine ligase [uncultured Eudoraea sp.]
MKLIFDKKELQSCLSSHEDEAKMLGLVPTMGALHEGHLSLVRQALSENSRVVVSIFVNPTQFNNPEDLKKYPKTLETDMALLESVSDEIIVFAPTVSELYTQNISSKNYSFNGLDKVMEGAFREGHFNGVATIVEILLDLVRPNKAYFGEKDFQQLQIVRKLSHELPFKVKIVGCPIVREPHGLAMSSRNQLLSKRMRQRAGIIFKTLQTAHSMFGTKNATVIVAYVNSVFAKEADLELEYFQIADVETLTPMQRKQDNIKYRGFIAVYAEGVRLIDNIAMN